MNIINFIFVPKILNFVFMLQVFSSIGLPAIVLLIEYLGKTMAFSMKMNNDETFNVDNNLIPDKEVVKTTIRKYEGFSSLNSLPAVFFSNIVWALTYIPTNLPNNSVIKIMLVIEIIILVIDSILYGYSYLGLPNKKGIKIIETIIFVILLLCSYFMLIIGPKIN